MGELARHLGVKVPYVSDVELGERAPFTPERIMATAKFLELSDDEVEDLLVAAAKYTGAFHLDALRGSSRARREAGAALMRGWPELNDEDLLEIRRVVRRRTKSDAD